MKVKGYDKIVDIVNNMGGIYLTERGLDSLVELSGEAGIPKEKAEPFVEVLRGRLSLIDLGYIPESKRKYTMTYEVVKTVITVRVVCSLEFDVMAVQEWVIKLRLV